MQRKAHRLYALPWSLLVRLTMNLYFWSKVNIWNVSCARATAFIFDIRTGVLVKVSNCWDRKCLDLRGTLTPNLRIHAEWSNLLSYQGQTFAVPWLEHWLWRYRYFLSKVNVWNVNCARATAFIFDTRTGVLVKVSQLVFLFTLWQNKLWCVSTRIILLKSYTVCLTWVWSC